MSLLFRASVVFVVNILIIKQIECHPTGAPEGVCDDLVPRHPTQPQTSKSPYVLVAKEGNDSIELIIQSSQNIAFKGFAIQALYANGTHAGIGRFVPKETNVHTINCFGQQDNTITHSDNKDKQRVAVEWVPNDGMAKGTAIKFVGTVVRDYKHFWINQSSAIVVVNTHEDIKGNSLDDNSSHHQKDHHDDHKTIKANSSLQKSLDSFLIIFLSVLLFRKL